MEVGDVSGHQCVLVDYCRAGNDGISETHLSTASQIDRGENYPFGQGYALDRVEEPTKKLPVGFVKLVVAEHLNSADGRDSGRLGFDEIA